MSGARDWDAATYDRLPIPMTAWGLAVVARLELTGDERVLDAGCGTGQVTIALRDRLPKGSVVALDGSAAMIERARERLGHDRVEYLVADLAAPLPLTRPVDAILSTATFHWVRDHDALFRNLAAVLVPGGQIAAQWGGEGNIANVEAALEAIGVDPRGRKHFASAEGTARRLEAAGFVDVEVWTTHEPSPVPARDLVPYLETICLGDHVEGMNPDERRRFAERVASRMPEPTIDYVRLNVTARRG